MNKSDKQYSMSTSKLRRIQKVLKDMSKAEQERDLGVWVGKMQL